jgi:hypothetical protein
VISGYKLPVRSHSQFRRWPRYIAESDALANQFGSHVTVEIQVLSSPNGKRETAARGSHPSLSGECRINEVLTI